ncbi:MAG: aminoacyl-tRNA hydrolase [Desulfobacterales bacterium]|nr:aminoacyl-tRNA hydrolase [Desulfobacterales bacterium]
MANVFNPFPLHSESAGEPDRRLWLLAGLGNPGPDYAATRHNIGFMVADALAEHWGLGFTDHGPYRVTDRAVVASDTVILAKPMAYMNRSGPPLRGIARRLSLTFKDLVIIHDDLDLAFGRLKIKEKGGDGGHKGIRSIMDAFASGDFVRLRVGIGRPDTGTAVVDHVLGPFNAEEQAVLSQVVVRAREAVVTVLEEGARTAMARFNVRQTEQSSL